MFAKAISILLIGAALGLGGCTTIAQVAVDEAKSDEPTPYKPKTRVFGKYGYGEDRLDNGSYEVWFYGNALTTPERVLDVVIFRAAEIGRADGKTHFVMANDPRYPGAIICKGSVGGAYISDIQVWLQQIVTYGGVGQLSGTVFSVSDVLKQLSDRVRTPNITEEDEQRIYTSNRLSCVNNQRFLPEDVETYQELIESGALSTS
ncbi:MAG: hypothetical protein COA62_10250 [Rhodobiaceae bacterium]|nr:MAG: hypothetical protein COA62_10250 [Rhodobiaceae bacterium]